MPCYYDIPNSNDQEEIERRCKERMYFDVQGLLTKEQAQECEKRNLKTFPMGDVNEHLCKICQVLTKEQMEQTSAYQWQIEWPHKTLNDWYVQHCKDDFYNNKEN